MCIPISSNQLMIIEISSSRNVHLTNRSLELSSSKARLKTQGPQNGIITEQQSLLQNFIRIDPSHEALSLGTI